MAARNNSAAVKAATMVAGAHFKIASLVAFRLTPRSLREAQIRKDRAGLLLPMYFLRHPQLLLNAPQFESHRIAFQYL